jgi:glycine/D-amino acid oxidase-like deaminating enzyme
MRQIFSSYAYGPGPRAGCWWDQTVSPTTYGELTGDIAVDVAIVGAGFTGLSAGLHLAQDGIQVAVLDRAQVGWGASGRNGGFCCLGGTIAADDVLDKRFGKSGRLDMRQAEQAAVHLVAQLIDEHKMSVDRHSNGETELAHRPRDFEHLELKQAVLARDYGINADLLGPGDLTGQGISGPFFGGLTVPIGFALNPAKYLHGLAQAAQKAGAKIFEHSAVRAITPVSGGHRIETENGVIRARQVIIATNGYSSEDVPPSLAGRYLPTQSSIMVTRPLSDAEWAAQGWHSDQMCFDTRNLLHYFRRLPDGRFLFGMRGGLRSNPKSEAHARVMVLRDFHEMFPHWAHIDADHYWSGLVCLSRSGLPFVGQLPQPGLWAGLCYHGNGVAMGSFAGKLLAQLVQGKTPDLYPKALSGPLARFPLGRWRRLLLPVAYAGLMLADR